MANDVRVVVRADTGGARQEIRSFADEIQTGLLSASNLAKGALLGLGAAGVGGFGFAVKAAADFEHQLSQVGAIAGASKGELAGLADTATRIGAETAFSASQAAGAMEVLAANGISVADIMGGAADAAAALAAAGGTDLVTAANIASTAMSVWGMQTSQLTDVVNRLAGAANTSRFGVEDMGQAIAQGGGVAAAAGVQFDDFAATIAATAHYFSSGADAGTSFKTFLTALAGNSQQAKETIAALGLEFYNAQGQLRPMSEIVQELHDKLGGLSEQQQTVALKTIFGNDAYRTAAGLMRLTGQEFEALSQQMGSTNAADVAAQRMDNLSGQVEELKGSLETMAIGVGSMVLPALTQMAGGATTAVNAIAGLPSSTQALALAFGALAVAAGPAVKAAQSLYSAFQSLKAGSLTLTTGIAGVTAGIGALAVGADLILQKTTGHGLIEWIFGDPAAAERAEAALKAVNAELEMLGQNADRGLYLRDQIEQAAAAWEQFSAAVRESGQDDLPLWQRSDAVQDFARSARDAEERITALGKAMRESGASSAEILTTYYSLTGRLQELFAAAVDINPIIEAQTRALEAAQRGGDDAAESIRALKEQLLPAREEAQAAANSYRDFAAGMDASAMSANELKGVLDGLAATFADANPQYQEASFLLAVYGEELADLKAKGDAATQAERDRMQVLEGLIQALGEQTAAMEDNKAAVESMADTIRRAIGDEGYVGLMRAMDDAKRSHEDQIDVLSRLGRAYYALTTGDLQTFRREMDGLKQVLSPEEFYQIAVRAGTAVGDGLADAIYGQLPAVGASAEALMDAALVDEQRASSGGYGVGAAIGRGVVAGLNDPGVLQSIWDTGNAYVERLRKVLEIYSPSRVTRDEVGVPMGEGIVQGLAAARESLHDIARTLMHNLEAGIEMGRDGIVGVMEQIAEGVAKVADEGIRWRVHDALQQMLSDLDAGLGVANAALAELATTVARALDGASGGVTAVVNAARSAGAVIGTPVGELRGSNVPAGADEALRIADALLRNLEAGVALSLDDALRVIDELQRLSTGIMDDATRLQVQAAIHAIQTGAAQGRGVSNAEAAEVARQIAAGLKAAAASMGGLATIDPRIDPRTQGYGVSGYDPSAGGVAPTGAHGVQMVWDQRARAWVMPWEVGAYGTQTDWVRQLESVQRYGPPAQTIPATRTVVLELNGREVARAILPDMLSEAERQGVALA